MDKICGRTIVKVRHLTKAGLEYEGWPLDMQVIALELDDGTIIYPSQDGEGNAPGVLFGKNEGGEFAVTVALNPDDLTELPNPEVIEAALEALDFKDQKQAEDGHNLLWKVCFLGALAAWKRAHGQRKDRTCQRKFRNWRAARPSPCTKCPRAHALTVRPGSTTRSVGGVRFFPRTPTIQSHYTTLTFTSRNGAGTSGVARTAIQKGSGGLLPSL